MSWYNPFSWGEEDMDDVHGYLDQMEPMLHEQYDPYRNAGLEAMPTLQEQYSQLLSNPAAMQAMLGQGFQESPGYQYQLQEGLNAADMASARGGMLGTNQHQTEAQKIAQGLANQDYGNYYNRNQNLFNQGLTGTQGLFDTGFDATNQLASGLGNVYGNQADLAYGNVQSQNNMFGSVLGAGLTAAGYALGGPMGGMAADALTNGMGQTPQAPSSQINYDWGNYGKNGWMR